MRKIIVTGANGFIGTSLCKTLIERDYNVTGIVRSNVITSSSLNPKYINYNKFFFDSLRGAECIIHCAAKAHFYNHNETDNQNTFKNINIELTRSLAEKAVSTGIKRFIFLSSIGVNGINTSNFKPFTNKDIAAPVEKYSISKFEAEVLLKKMSDKFGIEIVIIRPPLVYGYGVKGNFLRLLNLIEKNIPLPFARINNKRSFIGLDNLIDLIICCIDHPKVVSQTLLVSDGEDISTPDLIRKLRKIMGKPSLLIPFPVSLIKFISKILKKSTEAERLLNSLQVDSSFTNELLGWKPKVSLDEGLSQMVRWYLRNR